MRIIAACILAFFAASAVAESLVIDDANIRSIYSFNERGPLHFCHFTTTMAKAPMVIKLTALFITDDAKPKDKNLTVGYGVDAILVGAPNASNKLEQIKVISGKIISDTFNSDVHASKNVDDGLSASYNITSPDSLALFLDLLTIRGAYKLAVEFENNPGLIVNVKPTPETFNAGEKWNLCGVAIMEHRPPQ